MPRNPAIFIPLWERALEAEIGIGIRTNNPQLLRQELSRVRDSRPEFQDIIIFLPANGEEVLMCRKTVEIE